MGKLKKKGGGGGADHPASSTEKATFAGRLFDLNSHRDIFPRTNSITRIVSVAVVAILRVVAHVAIVFLMDHPFTFWMTAWCMRAAIGRCIRLVVLRVWPKWTSAKRRTGLIRATERSTAVRIILGLLARIIGV